MLLVMPTGASVTLNGSQSNGYQNVTYNGTTGWAFGDYLTTGSVPTTPTPPPSTGATGPAKVTTSLNLRSGPGTSFGVVTVMPRGAVVSLTGETSNGYLGLTYNGASGYAAEQYLEIGAAAPPASSGVGTATVIDGTLNLRAQASTSSAVLLVLPDGAIVTLNGDEQNGFTSVTYNGTAGWAYSLYLE